MILEKNGAYFDLNKIKRRNQPLKELLQEEIRYMLEKYGFEEENKSLYKKENIQISVKINFTIV